MRVFGFDLCVLILQKYVMPKVAQKFGICSTKSTYKEILETNGFALTSAIFKSHTTDRLYDISIKSGHYVSENLNKSRPKNS